MVTDVTLCDLVPCPEIIQPPQPVIVRPGKVATFPCLAWSYGCLVYRWSKDNYTSLPSNGMVSFKDSIFSMGTSCTTTMYQLTFTHQMKVYIAV